MDVFQKNILGGGDVVSSKKDIKSSAPKKSSDVKKPFVDVTIMDAVENERAEGSAMLIHRVLQKKIIYGGMKSSESMHKFLKVVNNEMMIKMGELDAGTATRDSLIEFFAKKNRA